jgi:hypothetical protein
MKARIFLEKIGAATLSFYIISAIFIYIIIHYKNGYNEASKMPSKNMEYGSIAMSKRR